MDAPDSISFDDSLWPLLVVTFPRVLDAHHQERYLARVKTYLARGERYVSVLDTRPLKTMTAEHRQRQADFIKEHEALFRRYSLGAVGIVTSPLVALGARVLIHLKPMPTPYYVASSFPAAVAWAAERLDSAALHGAAHQVRLHHGLIAEQHVG